jgi:fatty acid desaturase
MDHRAFLSALPTATRTRLTTPDAGPARLRLAVHVAAILGLGVWVASGWAAWWLAIPPLGLMIAFTFAIAHEATHRTLLPDPRWNDAVGHVCGFLIALPFRWFRWFHMAHHSHTNDPDRDPEIAGGPRPASRAAWAWHVSGLPYWMAEARVIWRLARGGADDGFIPAGARAGVVAEARWMLAGYALAALSLTLTPLLFWVWLLPVALGQTVLRIFLLAEHADCPQVPDMFDNTRTTLTTRLARLISWNMSFHVAHHVCPQVPFHRLPALHALMHQDLRHTANGYAAFTRDFLARHP